MSNSLNLEGLTCAEIYYILIPDCTPRNLGKGKPMPKILVVDDEAELRVLIVKTLEGSGYTAESAACVAEAMEKISEETFDLIITDFNMPVENGDVLLAKIRALPFTHDSRTVPVMIMTGCINNKIPVDTLGKLIVVYKPFSLGDLRTEVASMLEK